MNVSTVLDTVFLGKVFVSTSFYVNMLLGDINLHVLYAIQYKNHLSAARKKMNKIFALFSLATFIWHASLFINTMSTDFCIIFAGMLLLLPPLISYTTIKTEVKEP